MYLSVSPPLHFNVFTVALLYNLCVTEKNADSCSLKRKSRCGNWTELILLFRFITLPPVRVYVGLRSSQSDFIILSISDSV